jgi:tetratricopeptide (TPR) repeat protein
LTKDGGGPQWRASTKEEKLDYPAKETALDFGTKYVWSVKAKLPGGSQKLVVNASEFTVLLKGEPEELVAVKKLAESDDVENLLLAVAAFEGYGVYNEALRVFEKLARLQPGVARYQLGLGRYYQYAGDADKAREALEKAKKLTAPAKK